MRKDYRKKFKQRRALRKHFAEMIMFWDAMIKSESDEKTRELCLDFRRYWKRKLRKLR